jgi:hypothetical protein
MDCTASNIEIYPNNLKILIRKLFDFQEVKANKSDVSPVPCYKAIITKNWRGR